MEILFIIACIAVALAVPLFTGWIRKPRTAALVSKLYSVIAYALFVTSIILFVVAEETLYSIYEARVLCGGSGIEVSGMQCAICHGAGEILASHAASTIPQLYPICMILLGLYIAIFSFALKSLAEPSGKNRRSSANRMK